MPDLPVLVVPSVIAALLMWLGVELLGAEQFFAAYFTSPLVIDLR